MRAYRRGEVDGAIKVQDYRGHPMGGGTRQYRRADAEAAIQLEQPSERDVRENTEGGGRRRGQERTERRGEETRGGKEDKGGGAKGHY